jgi:hypothetical protein
MAVFAACQWVWHLIFSGQASFADKYTCPLYYTVLCPVIKICPVFSGIFNFLRLAWQLAGRRVKKPETGL